ncbi:hypothetical protein BH18ACT12_BH18ACT12_00650 [soil metagenome]
MSVSEVLREAFELYKRFFLRFVATAAVVFVVLDLASAFADKAAGESVSSDLLWSLIAIVLSVVGAFWVQDALIEGVSDVRDGRIDTTIGDLFERTRPRLPALIAAGIVAGIGVAIGIILLIVPGLFLLTRWALIPAVIVIEKRSAGDSFDRSWDLTRGHGWAVFGSIIVSFILYAIALALFRALFLPLPRFAEIWIGGFVAHSITTPFIALVGAVMYFRLARLSAGVDPAPPTPAT